MQNKARRIEAAQTAARLVQVRNQPGMKKEVAETF